MKKFLIALAVVLTGAFACKKVVDNGGLCACSPITGPEMLLVVKSTANADLLNSQTAGAYTKEQIQLYRKDAQGAAIAMPFYLRQPFTYGNDTFTFNSLYIPLSAFKGSPETPFYLKLGDKEYKMTLQLKQDKFGVDKLFIDDKEAEKATGTLATYTSVFYLTEVK